jgi:hypothetical protein
MAFNYSGSDFVSFAVYADVAARDQRFFEANEGFTTLEVNDLMALASQRILTQLRNTDWWKEYQRKLGNVSDLTLLPAVDPDNIKFREQEFKDLNVYFALSEYLLPRVADFGNETSAEVVKIKFYKDQFVLLFNEVLNAGDWYDYNADGTVASTERLPSIQNRVRTR